ncbi:Microtubule-associated protein, microtubule dynamics during spindle orientation [Tulasnella sp. 403]|nr:Microtubule-associated protein, microtubule dynamics during spindle orientation [Tulasnella sp. 403]
MDGPLPPEEDFSTIPLLDRIVHKNWKARLDGYEALPKVFQLTTSDSDPTFKPYLSDPGLLKKIVTDANAVAQEKGVEAICALVQYSGENSARTRDTVVPALVDKCLGSTRAGTKNKAIELILKYVEVENGGDGVVRDLLPGLSAKQPKVVSGTVAALNEVFKGFGIKVVPPKETLKVLPKIFGHTDKTVRAEGTALVQTLYTYLGPGIQPFLSDLKPVQVKELTESFSKLDESNAGQGTGKQARFTRAQEREREAAELAGAVDDAAEEEQEAAPDPRMLMDEVDIIPRIPPDFHAMVASSKWKERKEVLDLTLEVVNNNPRIKDADGIGDLSKALGKRMTDANIQCVIAAAQVIEGLAKGIGSGFGKYRSAVIPPMMERFKERKQNVVDAIGQGLDAVFATTTLPDITEDILTSLKSKNPQVKEGTAKFLVRSLSTTKVPPAKNDIKPMSETLVTLMEDSFEPVRAAAAEGLGTLLKIVGERQLNPVIDPLDDIRKAKVKEAFEKATVKCKVGVAPKPAVPPKAAPAAARKAPRPPPVNGDADEVFLNDVDATPKAKPPARFLAKKAPALPAMDEEFESPRVAPPARLLKKKEPEELLEDGPAKPLAKPPARPLVKKPAAAAGSSASGGGAGPSTTAPAPKKLPPAAVPAGKSGNKGAGPPSMEVKYKFSSEDAEAMAAELIPEQIQADLGDANWKVRLAAMDEFNSWLEGGAADTAECEVLFRFMSKKPGWGEKNFQVSAKVYGALAVLAERSPTFSKSCVALSTGHLAEKLGDMKLKKPAGDTLLLFAEKTSLSFILEQAYDPMSKQKAPKVLADSISWIGQALTDFGIAGLSLRSLVEFLKTALKNSNAAVRSSATNTLVTLRLFAGPSVRDLLEDLNPQLLSTIDTEFGKVDRQAPPIPTRFSADNVAVASSDGKGKGSDPLDELFPRVDLDRLVAGTTILNDAKSEAWKTRKEALELLQSILDVGANKRLKPNMGDIGQVLKARLADSNKVVQLLALDIISRIATGMNKPFEKHVRLLARPIADVLADQKANIRSAGTATLSAVAMACEGIDPLVNPLSGALETNNPLSRSCLLAWMAEWLQAHPSSVDLSALTPRVVGCLEDRSGDVRKGAQAVLPHLISSVGFDAVMERANSLKPASRSTVVPMVQAAKALARPPVATSTASSSSKPSHQPRASVSPPEEPSAPAAVPKRQVTNLRLRKIEPLSRPESRADSIAEPPSAGPTLSGFARPGASRLAPSARDTPKADGVPFTGGTLEGKRSRVGKDGTRWIIEGLPVRKDLPEILQHQMDATFTGELLSLLFSKDHNAVNDFVKGLGNICEGYSQILDDDDHSKTLLLANSDLCFKYVAIRIHEPQSNLVVRCLDVLDNIIAFLTSNDQTISDAEAQCILPTVIHKLGDGRETVRVRVQTIVQNFARIFPPSNIFQNLLNHGLRSKNAKTRQGALEEIGYILKRHGMNVCDPPKAFPVIASMIADASVRKAALSAISEGYVLCGEKIWQYVGPLSPKDKTQLEERLKRTSGPSKPPSPPRLESPAISRLAAPSGRPGSPSPALRLGGIPRAASPALSNVTRPGSPSGLASPSHGTSANGPSSPRRRSLLPSRLGPPRSRLNPTSPTSSVGEPESRAPQTWDGRAKHANGKRIPSSSDDPDATITAEEPDNISIIISSILSSDPSRSVDALKKIQKILDVPDAEKTHPLFKDLAEHTEGLVETITLQMSHVFDRADDVAEPGNFRLAKHLIQTLNSFCDHAILAESLTVEILTSLLEELTMRLLQTDESADAKVKDLSRFINMIVLRIFATGRRISIFRALFNLLLQITKPFPANATSPGSKDAKLAELVLKCVWKMARSIPQELTKGTLDAVELFPAIEQFLQSVPPNEWRQRAQSSVPVGDMPLRTIKVIIQHIVAQYPETVYDQLSEAFDDPSATIVYPYVYRILNSTTSRPVVEEDARRRTNGSARSGSPSSSRASPPIDGNGAARDRSREPSALGTTLSGSSLAEADRGTMYSGASEPDPDARLNEIIDHISSETTGAMHKEGITELHHFLKEFPHKKAKVDKMLEATGPAFRKYIARALASRATEDEERDVAVHGTLSKLESVKRESLDVGASRRVSISGFGPTSPTQSVITPRRVSVGNIDRRFSVASDAPLADDKALSRLHDIFQYHGRSSISSNGTHRDSLPSHSES